MQFVRHIAWRQMTHRQQQTTGNVPNDPSTWTSVLCREGLVLAEAQIWGHPYHWEPLKSTTPKWRRPECRNRTAMSMGMELIKYIEKLMQPHNSDGILPEPSRIFQWCNAITKSTQVSTMFSDSFKYNCVLFASTSCVARVDKRAPQIANQNRPHNLMQILFQHEYNIQD